MPMAPVTFSVTRMKGPRIKLIQPLVFVCILTLGQRVPAQTLPVTPAQIDQRGVRGMLQSNIDRPLRYTPDHGDFVIVNGDEFFNRSLYGGSSPFRVDGGDRPEFSFYLPGHGGNLRLGFTTSGGTNGFTRRSAWRRGIAVAL